MFVYKKQCTSFVNEFSYACVVAKLFQDPSKQATSHLPTNQYNNQQQPHSK